jgi:hypothetical protein
MQVVDLATIANVATALTVITGVGFGLVEAQRSRRARQERAAFAAVQAILTPEWMKSMVVVHSIPDGSSASAIEADVRVLDAAHAVGVILEGLGYSVYARLFLCVSSGTLWAAPSGSPGANCGPTSKRSAGAAAHRKLLKWFQWLAAQLERYSPGKTNLQVGAHEAYRDWKPR